jgi:hypothetical protein
MGRNHRLGLLHDRPDLVPQLRIRRLTELGQHLVLLLGDMPPNLGAELVHLPARLSLGRIDLLDIGKESLHVLVLVDRAVGKLTAALHFGPKQRIKVSSTAA